MKVELSSDLCSASAYSNSRTKTIFLNTSVFLKRRGIKVWGKSESDILNASTPTRAFQAPMLEMLIQALNHEFIHLLLFELKENAAFDPICSSDHFETNGF